MIPYLRKRYANLILRVSLGAMFLYSGLNFILTGSSVPVDLIVYELDPLIFTPLIAVLQVLVGLGLVLGFLTSLTSLFAAIMVLITLTANAFIGQYNSSFFIANIGLLGMSLSLTMSDSDYLCLDNIRKRPSVSSGSGNKVMDFLRRFI